MDINKRQYSRIAIAGIASMAMLLGIAACGETNGSDSGASTDGKVNLSLMIWDPAQKDGVQKAVDGFEKENPDISVDLQQVPEDQYYTKLDASLGAGEGPDVMWQSSKAPEYVDGGGLEPLDDYIKKDNVDLAEFPDKLVKLYNIGGKQYGMPKDQDVWAFYYNTEVFKKLGITDVPTVDWTWDDMVRIAKEIKAKQTGQNEYPMYMWTTFNNGVASLVHQMGGEVIKDNKGVTANENTTKALKQLKELQDEGLMPKAADSTDFNAANSLISGTIAMSEIPSYQLPLISKANLAKGTIKAVPMPSTNGSHATDTNGLSYTMNANCKNKDAAWKLIKFLTSDEGAKLHAEGGANPPASTNPDVQDAYYKSNDSVDGLKEAFTPMIKESYLRTTTQYPKTRGNFPQIEALTGDYYAGADAQQTEQKIDEILTESLAQ